MATLVPTLTLTSTDVSSSSLSLSVSDSLSITKNVVNISKVQLSTSDLTLASTDYGKSYVYLKNTDSAIAMTVDVTDGNAVMSLAAGEFAFFPWSGSAAIIAFAASGTPFLEYGIFEA
jgi:hypothetical protein